MQQCREKQHSQQQKARAEQCYLEWLAGKAAQEQRRRVALQRTTNRRRTEELQVRPMIASSLDPPSLHFTGGEGGSNKLD